MHVSGKAVAVRIQHRLDNNADRIELTHKNASDLIFYLNEIKWQLAQQQQQNELYAAEMSEAKAAGFETAQDLFTSYKALQQQVLEQQAVIATAKAALSMAWSDKYINGIEARKMAEVVQQIGYSQALTDHVNAEKVKMLEEAMNKCNALFDKISPYSSQSNDYKSGYSDGSGDCGNLIQDMIAELTKPTGEE